MNSLIFSSWNALSLFWNWDLSFWQVTTIPVGKCVMRIADDVLLMCWPPAPDDLYVSIRISFGSISMSRSSSISGMTSQAEKDVWRFPFALNGDILTSLWTPCSDFRSP